MKKTWMNPKISVLKSKIQGKGMFASSEINENEVIVIWGGKGYVNKEEAEKILKEGKHLMQWDDDVYSYDAGEENQDIFSINHSCDPNAWMKDAYTIIARKDIKKYEEITTDYALWECNELYVFPWLCNCNSKQCRKQITGKDWKNLTIQNYYKGHFSPLIQKLINEHLSLAINLIQ